ncbi:MAG: TIGR02301 family protein [Xanthobacteraceae bacterium]|nr:TIGR02301 family protein [Xanthobacteraceae bacterium]
MIRRVPVILAICLAVAVPNLAQAQREPAPAAPAPAIQGGPAPFEADLMRLSEILGALQYLRALCGANEGQKWRDEMQALIEAEAVTPDRKNRMVANFNRGYRSFQQAYRTCTPAANVAVRRYLDEGAKISREITARYTN